MSRVFVLGNASIDVTLPVPRLPSPGETLMATGIARSPGGKGLNQAVVAVRGGVEVHFCAPLGVEPETAMLRAALAAEGFAALRLPDVAQPSDLSILLVADDGENSIVSIGACAEALPVSCAEAFVAAMADDDLLLLQGNLSQMATLAAARLAPRVIINTAPLRWPIAEVVRYCEIVIANRLEAEQITGCSDPAAAATRLGSRIGIVTNGKDGCVVATADGVSHFPACTVSRTVDTTGAGDSFCGALVAGLARGMSLTGAVAAAQQAAALAVGRHGCFPALPTRSEMTAIFGPAGRCL